MTFFDLDDTPSNISERGSSGRTLSCPSCGLYKNNLHPKMEEHGYGRKDVLWIGEAPGQQEDKVGNHWQGKTGQALRRLLKTHFDFDLQKDAVCINAVNCQPPKNRTPLPHEVACCRKRVLEVVERVKPHLIILSGGSALESIIGHRWQADLKGISRWRGWAIPDRELNAWVCPVFHPSYVERSSDMPQVERVFLRDLENAMFYIDHPFPVTWVNEKDQVRVVKEPEKVVQLLTRISKKAKTIAFDYEATGLKPHKKGHEIVCVSVAMSEDLAYSFPLHKHPPILKRWRNILQDPSIHKMAHNLQYEDTWSNVLLGAEVKSWYWDSMVAAHILDNRKYITGLKFQAAVRFGIYDYASEVSPFLKGVEAKNGNSFNRVLEFMEKPGGFDKLLTYCGMDSLLEYRLAMIQMEEVGV